MTPFPHSIDVSSKLDEARAMMDEHDIHHLPVTEDGQLVGLVSHRDLAVAKVFDEEAGGVLGSVCRREPYVVDFRTSLDTVALEMSARRIGSALVTRNDKLVGILTHTNVSKLLGETLRTLFPTPGDDEPA
jgi:acetoin utilization protein AcuB